MFSVCPYFTGVLHHKFTKITTYYSAAQNKYHTNEKCRHWKVGGRVLQLASWRLWLSYTSRTDTSCAYTHTVTDLRTHLLQKHYSTPVTWVHKPLWVGLCTHGQHAHR